MSPDTLFGVLADPTRLRALMLIRSEGEVCVCELTHALQESQPKVSRHLAFMRDAGIVKARRQGTWMHYRIDPDAPEWAREIVESAFRQLRNLRPFQLDKRRLTRMGNRPDRICA